MVFWLIAMLSMIIYSMHTIVSHDLELTISQKNAFRARQLAEMGINWAMNPNVKKFDTAILQQGGGEGGGGGIIPLEEGESFWVKIKGEGGRMNINALLQNDVPHRDFLTKLFNLWGLDNEQADTLFDCMIDWTDAGDEQLLHGMERKAYLDRDQVEQSPYPFNRPFYTLEEVRLVEGFAVIEANVPEWRDYFTIYSAGKLDVNEAEAKVMAAAAVACKGTSDPQRDFEDALKDANELVSHRFGADELEDTEDDRKLTAAEVIAGFGLSNDPGSSEGAMATAIFGENDPTVHIESVATVGEYRKRVVLIVRNRTQNPQILSREEVPLFQ
jgi:type II secretory pathway component PulK